MKLDLGNQNVLGTHTDIWKCIYKSLIFLSHCEPVCLYQIPETLLRRTMFVQLDLLFLQYDLLDEKAQIRWKQAFPLCYHENHYQNICIMVAAEKAFWNLISLLYEIWRKILIFVHKEIWLQHSACICILLKILPYASIENENLKKWNRIRNFQIYTLICIFDWGGRWNIQQAKHPGSIIHYPVLKR